MHFLFYFVKYVNLLTYCNILEDHFFQQRKQLFYKSRLIIQKGWLKVVDNFTNLRNFHRIRKIEGKLSKGVHNSGSLQLQTVEAPKIPTYNMYPPPPQGNLMTV